MKDIPLQYAVAPKSLKGVVKFAVATAIVYPDGGHQMVKRAVDSSFFSSNLDSACDKAECLISKGCNVRFVLAIDDTGCHPIRSFDSQPSELSKMADEPGEYEDGGSW